LLSEGGTVSGELRCQPQIQCAEKLAIHKVLFVKLRLLGGRRFSWPSGRARRVSIALGRNCHIPGTVFTGDTDLLGSLRHLGLIVLRCGDVFLV